MSKDKKTYEIYGWNGILYGNNTYPITSIYIKPDVNLLNFAKKNNNVLIVNIHGTNIYDCQDIKGILKKSADIPKPNSRPNFFEKTGYYSIDLQMYWQGEPDTYGVCYIHGINEVPTNKMEENNKLHKVKFESENEISKTKGMDLYNISVISSGLTVILILVLFIIKK